LLQLGRFRAAGAINFDYQVSCGQFPPFGKLRYIAESSASPPAVMLTNLPLSPRFNIIGTSKHVVFYSLTT
jgi:hypothetical protein